MRRDIASSLGIKVYLKPDTVPLIDVANVMEEEESAPRQARDKILDIPGQYRNAQLLPFANRIEIEFGCRRSNTALSVYLENCQPTRMA